MYFILLLVVYALLKAIYYQGNQSTLSKHEDGNLHWRADVRYE
jgi:hypothetical protein